MKIEEAESISFQLCIDDDVFLACRRTKDGKWERRVNGHLIEASEDQESMLEKIFKDWLSVYYA